MLIGFLILVTLASLLWGISLLLTSKPASPPAPAIESLKKDLADCRQVNQRLHAITFAAIKSRDAMAKRYADLHDQMIDSVLELDAEEKEDNEGETGPAG